MMLKARSKGRDDRVRVCADRTAFDQDHEIRLRRGHARYLNTPSTRGPEHSKV